MAGEINIEETVERVTAVIKSQIYAFAGGVVVGGLLVAGGVFVGILLATVGGE